MNHITPWKNARFTIIGGGISLILLFLTMFLPFYSFLYFYQGTTMNFLQVMKENNIIILPFTSLVCAILFQITSSFLLLFFYNKKQVLIVANILSFVSAILSLCVFVISVCRIWVIPYSFDYTSFQKLLIGYVIYVVLCLYHGILSCYTLAVLCHR